MKAVVYHGRGDIRLDDVPEPNIKEPTDAIVRLTASAICGTDLHFVRGSIGGLEPGTILGHEGVGVVEEVGSSVRNLRTGDRVVIPSTVACGTCVYCRASFYSKCDQANPQGPKNTAFFGGPKESGGLPGLQAQFARIPYANVGPVKLPDSVRDDDAIMLSDIFPTAYFAAEMASIKPGHVVVVLGCGPVGQLAIASAKLMDAGRIIAVDCIPSRLERARAQGAEVVDFSNDDPVKIVVDEMTSGIGVDCAIDAVGIDAYGTTGPPDSAYAAGDRPAQALEWAIDMVAKAGHVSIVGVYPTVLDRFPIGVAFGKNLTLRMGDCPHRRYIPRLVRMVTEGRVTPARLISQRTAISSALDAYRSFDRHDDGWLKVELLPSAQGAVTKGEARADQLITA